MLNANYSVIVYDLIGKKVFESPVTETKNQNFKFRLNNCSSGIYIMKIIPENGSSVPIKLIVE